jgi:uncharacterized protein (TIGR00297 family)
MSADMSNANAGSEEKADRERRLRWQSRLLLCLVLPLAALGLGLRLLPILTPASVEGLAVCACFGLLVFFLRAATPFAAVTGFLLTGCLYLSTVDQPNGGWFHTALPSGLALFVLAFAATRFRRAQKEQTGLAESRRGRASSQVAANMGAAALAALLLPPYPWESLLAAGSSYRARPHPALFMPLIAALAEAAADTVSSEIGQAIGGMPISIVGAKRIAPGTDGGITIAGTLAGGFAAAVLVLASIPTLGVNPRQAAIAWVAAMVGLFFDSLLGATLESRGWLNNDLVNFLSTAMAALVATAVH